MREPGAITGVSVDHTRASIDEIDLAGGDGVRATVSDLLAREGVDEAFAIQTCNRSAAFIVTDRQATAGAALRSFAPDVRDGAIRRFGHEESLEHLMRVATGLESLVLGEDQIIGQVREAYEESRSAGGVGPVLRDAVTKAIHVGERARNETSINEGVVSLGSAAVSLAAEETDLAGARAVVVGAGEMGTLAARALDDTPVAEIIVANRTIPHAAFIAEDVDTDGDVIPLVDLPRVIPDADLVITATGSPEPVIAAESLPSVGDLVCIDIARPRDVDPALGERPDVALFDIDALEQVTRETRERREDEARAVEAIITEELDRLLDAYKRKRADDAISTMYASADHMKTAEVEAALSKLEAQGGVTAEQRKTVEAMANALVGQLLAAPTKSLRDAAGEDDWETIRTALELFDPEFEARTEPAGDARDSSSPPDATATAAEKSDD